MLAPIRLTGCELISGASLSSLVLEIFKSRELRHKDVSWSFRLGQISWEWYKVNWLEERKPSRRDADVVQNLEHSTSGCRLALTIL